MASFAYLFERFPSFVQTFVYREAREMIRQEMKPFLVSIRHPDDAAAVAETLEAEVYYLPESDRMRSEIDALRRARKLSGKVHRTIPKARAERDSNRLFEAAWLGPVLREQGVQHVHAHFGGVAARTAWWLRELYGLTYSFTGHANDIFCENDFPITNADLVDGAKFIVTETDYARAWMENTYPQAKGRVFRVYNGIDREFPPRKPARGVVQILSVGRYVEKKGFHNLITACRLLRQKGIAFDCKIIGGGPLEAELQAQIEREAMQDCVHLLGPRSQREVREALAASHLFVLACVPDREGGSDNLPTVIMEAMICGVPVLSTRIAGVPEMIEHGKTGLLVEPNDPTALAGALEQLLADLPAAEALGRGAQSFALSHFSIEQTTRQLKHLLVTQAGVRPPSSARSLDPDLPKGPSWWRRLWRL